MVEEDRKTIEIIHKTSKLFAPDYDEDRIVKAILGMSLENEVKNALRKCMCC
jgi:hypothetical protein